MSISEQDSSRLSEVFTPECGGEYRRVPRFVTVKAVLERFIDSQKPGVRLPSERELATSLSVSRETLRQALSALTSEGRLSRQHGRGTFVTKPGHIGIHSLDAIVTGMDAAAFWPAKSAIVTKRPPADVDVVADLRLSRGAEAIRVERALMDVHGPVGLEVADLRADGFPTLPEVLKPGESIHQCLTNTFGVVVYSAEQYIGTASPTPRESEIAGVMPATLMLTLRQILYDTGGRPVARTSSLLRGDRVRLVGFVTGSE